MPLIDETHYDVYLHICYGTTALAQELASAMAQELVPALAQELAQELDVCGYVCGQPVELVLELELVLVQEPCFLLHDVTSSNRCQFYSCPHFLKCNLFVLPSL